MGPVLARAVLGARMSTASEPPPCWCSIRKLVRWVFLAGRKHWQPIPAFAFLTCLDISHRVLAIVALFGLCWVAVTWLVPQLPLRQCVTCEMRGDCHPVDCGESARETGLV